MLLRGLRFHKFVLMAVGLLLLTAIGSWAFPACDNFGQDWNINLGAFGGTFPGTMIVSGCRDCNGSLGCGGSLPLDGAAALTVGAPGSAYSVIWSLTAYRPAGTSTCVSTHWTGTMPGGGAVVHGNVSNEFGPAGTFTLKLASACGATTSMLGAGDPAHVAVGLWSATPADSRGNSFIVP